MVFNKPYSIKKLVTIDNYVQCIKFMQPVHFLKAVLQIFKKNPVKTKQNI